MSQPHRVRIGNQQREEAISALNDHFAAGRLEIGEYEQRVGYAAAAQTAQDLAALFRDLPQPHPRFLAPPPAYYPPPPPPVGYVPQYHATPYGVDPLTGQPLSDKSKIAAGVLQLVTPFGIGRFYIGDVAIGVAQLLTCGGCGIWTLIDGIILLVNGGTDAQGRKLRD
ncbi:DUF1707 domain-containing protein [Saccharothrix coeruleofusca]|uniref:Membrane protein n=1 Tax=Saccharothrix coeruleofusca TaxID=33919 RepID=A0A918AN97_9PSEU|nr:DUF1707 domain-containing protein [Saccharothrix coeruleofusca]MBP2338035.1 hypothetical protein [Saccharothrix coeruleofusca]GGP63916.1 membrane protein [Saccharothrix coeruleofusca]